MMRRLVAVALLALSTAAGAAANDSVVVPQAYRIGGSAQASGSGVFERPAASTCADPKACLDGPFYAEIFPIFSGSGGNTSFIRLGSGFTASSTFHIVVLGSPSGIKYGQADITVLAHASPQYSITDLLTAAGAGALANSDTAYALYVSNPDTASFYQHVIFNGSNSFFEDMTVCPPGSSVEGGRALTNIDTSKLAAWPATIYIHNTVAEDATYRVDVRNSKDGSLLGSIASLTVPANATYSVPFTFFEQQIGLTPVSGQEHATLEFHAIGTFLTDLGAGSDPTDVGAIFASAIFNQALSATINMSNKCSVNR